VGVAADRVVTMDLDGSKPILKEAYLALE